jgi:hypothetical protein
MKNPFRYFKMSLEVIRLAVMMVLSDKRERVGKTP